MSDNTKGSVLDIGHGHSTEWVGARGGTAALLLAVLGLVVLSGLRFSDGSVLLAMARGATLSDPAFASAGSQYVWDSPLKVLLLRYALPPQLWLIAAAFSVLSLLPLCGLLASDARTRKLAAVVVFLTPALKVSIQNIGVGDGLVLALTIVVCAARHAVISALALGAIALWHPQQACFIALSYLVAQHCYRGHIRPETWAAAVGSMLAGGAVFLIYRALLGFSYADRVEYLESSLPASLSRSVLYAPIAFAPILAWFALSQARPGRSAPLLVGWLTVLATVSWLTTDVTRIMTILSLPIVCAGASSAAPFETPRAGWSLAGWAALIALIPAYSWSGLDLFVWADLRLDACKWAAYCF